MNEGKILQNILARIHRDGGHYTELHGVEASAVDADIIVANLYEEVGDLRTKLIKAQDKLAEFDEVIDDFNIAVSCINPLEDLKNSIKALLQDYNKLYDILNTFSTECIESGHGTSMEVMEKLDEGKYAAKGL